MKYIIYILFISLPYFSIGQNWLWAKQMGSTSIDQVNKICTDKNGDIYVFGEFGYYFLIPDFMVFDTDTVWNEGVNQLFLAKYSSSGNILWTKSIGGENPYNHGSCNNCERSYGMTIDTVNEVIYISGKLFGTGVFGDTLLSGSGTMFLSKLDLNGNYLWSKLLGGSVNIGGNIACNQNSEILFSGYTPDSITLNNISIPPGYFLTQFDSSGNANWAKIISIGAQSTYLFFNRNSIYTFFITNNDTCLIDTVEIIFDSLSNIILSKFDSLGNLQWYKSISSSSLINAHLDIDSQSNLYITGTFINDINFGSISLTCINRDYFIVKFDQSGNLIWAKQGYSSDQAGLGILATTQDGYSSILGSFTGNITLGNYNLYSTSNECFLTCFDTNGNCLGVETISCIPGNGSIAINNNRNSILAAEFNLTFTIGTNTFSTYGANDLFLAKHDVITGFEEVNKKPSNQLLIYANPNQGKCNITVPDDLLNEKNLLLSIYDISGKLIQQKQLEMTEGKIKLDLQAEAKGIYNVTLSSKIKSYSGKIIFE